MEKVQQRATPLLPHLHDKSYVERLTLLSLPSLQYRRLRGDLIFLYKVLNNYFDTDLYNYCTPQLLLLGGTSLNCVKSIQDYYVDQITLLIGASMIGIVYLIML